MSISDKIAIASLIVTVVTLGIAIYALFTWKKQLKYNLIFDLEDKFNILIGVTTVNGNYCTAGIKK